ncbi:MAG: peptide deformylase [Alphaproteobacteria bacterium]|jgi:peptide deformylase|nr:peptide deformylase [Alphaproteobacteria bacterium]
MAILKIAKMGHPVLRRRSDPVANPGSPEVARLVADMLETLEDADGAGLAAAQVHVPLRVVMFHVPAGHDDDDNEPEPVPLIVLVNPEVEILTEEMETDWEGCLSVPGLIGAVPRYTAVRYRGTTPEGEAIDHEVQGFHARVVQHECDHLDGILYPQRMIDLSLLMFQDQMRYGPPRHEEDGEELDEATGEQAVAEETA